MINLGRSVTPCRIGVALQWRLGRAVGARNNHSVLVAGGGDRCLNATQVSGEGEELSGAAPAAGTGAASGIDVLAV
jgi:hypothetical protein